MPASMSNQATKKDDTRKRDDVPEMFKEILECPYCFEVIREPPIFMCDGPIGHSLCKSCYLSCVHLALSCLICGENMSKRRSHLLEKLVEELPKTCCKNTGCSFQTLNTKLLWKHEEEKCSHRKIPCGNCDKQIPLLKFAHHLERGHGLGKLKPVPFNISVGRSRRTENVALKAQYALGVRDCREIRPFLINWTTSTDGNCRIFWISYLGPKDQAKHYKYTIKIKSIEGEKTEYLFEGTRRCVPCDISHKTMKDKQYGILIDEELIQQAAGLDNKVHYCMKIKRTGE